MWKRGRKRRSRSKKRNDAEEDVDEEENDNAPKKRRTAKEVMDEAEEEYIESSVIEDSEDMESAAAWIARRMEVVTTEGGKSFLGNLAERVLKRFHDELSVAMLEYISDDDVQRMRAASSQWKRMQTHVEAMLQLVEDEEAKEELEYYMKHGISPFEAYKEVGGDSD